MESNSVRTWLVDKLQPKLPKTWRYITDERSLDDIDVPHVLLSHKSIQREPTNPQGHRRHTYTLTLLAPGVDFSQAETALGDDIEKLLLTLDTLDRGIAWDRAEKVLHASKYLAWEIDIFVITESKKPTPTPL